jgi:hypothetical protein
MRCAPYFQFVWEVFLETGDESSRPHALVQCSKLPNNWAKDRLASGHQEAI